MGRYFSSSGFYKRGGGIGTLGRERGVVGTQLDTNHRLLAKIAFGLATRKEAVQALRNSGKLPEEIIGLIKEEYGDRIVSIKDATLAHLPYCIQQGTVTHIIGLGAVSLKLNNERFETTERELPEILAIKALSTLLAKKGICAVTMDSNGQKQVLIDEVYRRTTVNDEGVKIFENSDFAGGVFFKMVNE